SQVDRSPLLPYLETGYTDSSIRQIRWSGTYGIVHAIGLTEAGHDVTLYTDASLMDPTWLSMLTPRVEVRNLPYGLKGGNVIRELNNFDKLIIHHHVEPLVAMRIVRKYSEKTYWYTGEVLRAIWEDWITGADYRQFSPTVF